MSGANQARVLVGIDENGLGPRLGPLLVTAVMARGPANIEGVLEQWHARSAARLGDSKALVAHGRIALAAAWARALVARGGGRTSVTGPVEPSADELLHAIALDDRAALRAPCPAGVLEQCWASMHDERLVEYGPDARQAQATLEADLQWLAGRGVEITAARSVIVCTRRLNDALRGGRSRLQVDLHAMERLVLALRDLAGGELTVVCGKVGGYREYGKAFGPLGQRLHVVVEEQRSRSSYQFPGLGRISFVQDADASDPLVGLASLVGKYLRELLMGRIVEHYRSADPSLPNASGYNDPVTARFVSGSAGARRERGVPDDCFERLARPRRAKQGG